MDNIEEVNELTQDLEKISISSNIAPFLPRLLRHAVRSNNIEAVEALLQHPFEIHSNPNQFNTHNTLATSTPPRTSIIIDRNTPPPPPEKQESQAKGKEETQNEDDEISTKRLQQQNLRSLSMIKSSIDPLLLNVVINARGHFHNTPLMTACTMRNHEITSFVCIAFVLFIYCL